MDKVFWSVANHEKSSEVLRSSFTTYLIDTIKSVWLPTDRVDRFNVEDLNEIKFNSHYDLIKTTEIFINPILFRFGDDYAPDCLDSRIPSIHHPDQNNGIFIYSTITDLTEEEKNKINAIGSLLKNCIDGIDDENKDVIFNW